MGSDQRHVFFTNDFKYLIVKPPSQKQVQDDNKIPIYKLTGVDRGRKSSTLEKKKLIGSEYVVPEERAFVIYRGKKSLDFQTDDASSRDRWYSALQQLFEYLGEEKKKNQFF